MELGFRDWMIIVGVLLILAVLVDGFRRMRNERRSNIRMSLNKQFLNSSVASDENSSELPNGGARYVGRPDRSPANHDIVPPLGDGELGYNELNSNECTPLSTESTESTESIEQTAQVVAANNPHLVEQEMVARDIAAREADKLNVTDQNTAHRSHTRSNITDPSITDPSIDDQYIDDQYRDDSGITDPNVVDSSALNLNTADLNTADSNAVCRNPIDLNPADLNPAEQEDGEDYFELEPPPSPRQQTDSLKNTQEKNQREAAAVDVVRATQPEEVIAINVIAKDGPFKGPDLLHILLACDLRFGDMNIFHRHEQANGKGAVQFSVANSVEPGFFDLDGINDFTTPGVCFFMGVPGPSEAIKAFEYMVETAQCLVTNLNGEMLDDSRSAMTNQTLEHCRQRLQDFERRQLAQQA